MRVTCRITRSLSAFPDSHTSQVGGIQSVTLGDEEAKRRGVQKSILERAAPPTFDVAVEMEERGRWRVHLDVAAAVDTLLAGAAGAGAGGGSSFQFPRRPNKTHEARGG